MRWSHGALVASLLISSVPARAVEPRQPTERWVVNFDDAQCVASRNYGTVEKPLHLALKASPLGDVIQLAILRHGIGGEAEQLDAILKIDDQPALRTTILVYKSENASLRIHRVNLRPTEFAPLRQAKSIAIQSPGLNETFALSNMGPLLKTMEECLVDLRSVWNITDPTGTKSKLKERSKANLSAYFSNDDYPAAAFTKEQSGIVAFALLIDEAGKVADCTIVETSGAAVLDTQSCGVLEKRARFKPAIGTDGKPAKDAVIGRIRWQMAK